MCSARSAAPSEQGFSLRTRYGLEDLVTADTVIVAAVPESVAYGEASSPELIEALRQAAGAGARMVSLCCGAFALAEAGLLDGRRATAHWMHTSALAKRAGMSTRTFHRHLRAVAGTTPLKWLLSQRIARAQTLLETTSLPIEKISEHSGLGTATNLRRHFAAHVGVTPTDYRRAFDSEKLEPGSTYKAFRQTVRPGGGSG